ncbi:hypothetical protein [Chitinophaga polysaccharea]|uniref:hypothetical protein n=1 Tax=Chitinophaga polysaccharea TaxID=1293035 RepID=UPI001156CEE3|nr:hypothetical protein [Chitinophaga polysaccharea]
METIKEETSTIVEIEKIEEEINEHYHAFYFTSETFVENVHESFFDDDFCAHAIEVLGGRSFANYCIYIFCKFSELGHSR